ncbi:MAG: MlaD family protein [Syntrophorhabdales bacterium]|jgi:phospholipid/cholesterol/gamma-HCH transport system substrate-binding protein
MAKGRSYFLLGLFVIVGVLIGAAAIIWLGATKYFQKGSMYATYFDESVQGLQVDSIVKYRGVDIGTVRLIDIAPDRRLVEVLMKIDVDNFSVNGVAAKLSLAGITGIVYVELDRTTPGEKTLSPKDFQSPYPVIPSAPSDIKQIEASVNDVLKSLKEIDLKGISDQVLKTTKTIDEFVSGERMNHILTNLGKASVNLASLTQKIDATMSNGSVDEVIQGARDAVKDARALIAQTRAEIEGMKLRQTAAKVGDLVEMTSRKTEVTLTDAGIAVESLRRAADSLEALIDRLSVDPSALIFSKPPKGE